MQGLLIIVNHLNQSSYNHLPTANGDGVFRRSPPVVARYLHCSRVCVSYLLVGGARSATDARYHFHTKWTYPELEHSCNNILIACLTPLAMACSCKRTGPLSWAFVTRTARRALPYINDSCTNPSAHQLRSFEKR